MRGKPSIVASIFIFFLTLTAATCFAQYDPNGLFQFSRYWQQEPSDETSYDLNLNPDAQIDAQDLLRLIQGIRTGASVPTSKETIVIELPEELPGAPADYSVASLLESASGSEEGSSLMVADTGAPSLLMLTNPSGKVVLLGYALPPSVASGKLSARLRSSVLRQGGGIEVSAESTALALVMMSPYLLGSTGPQRVEIAGEVVASATFPSLVQAVQAAITAHPDDPLNSQLHPELYEQAARLMIDILIARSADGKPGSRMTLEEHQWIVDDPSGNRAEVVIRNPKMTYFGVGFYDPEDDDLWLMGLAKRKGSLVDLFQWPPMFFAQPEETGFPVGDGRYNVSLYKGFNFGTFPIGEVFSYSLPQGRPTLANTAIATLMILDLVGGFGPEFFSLDSLEALFQIFEDIGEAGLIGEAISRGDVTGAISGLVQIMGSHQEEIVRWIWKSLGLDGRTKPVRLMKQIGGVFEDLALPLKIIGAANEQLPFFWDLVTPPYQLQFHIEQENGKLITMDEGPWAAPTPSPTETSTPTPTRTPFSGGDEISIPLPGGVTLEMVKIPAGSFMMGRYAGEQDSYSYEDFQHQVTISQDFYLGKYEVTKAQWTAVMGTTPWSGESYVLNDPNSPAVYVSWNDINGTGGFIEKLNALGQGTFRLPSEAEWEYACRAGTTTRFYWGDDPSYTQISDYAWWDGNAWDAYELYAHVVGLKLPNAWGLYDMSGNVWEWCQDYWHGNYTGAPANGSAWESPTSSYRVLRGGGWSGSGHYCRSAIRGGDSPDNRYGSSGLRLARTP